MTMTNTATKGGSQKCLVTKVFGLNSFLDYLTRRSLNEELKVTPVSTNIIGSMKSFYGGKDYI